MNTAVRPCICACCSTREGIAVPWRSSACLLQSCLRFGQNFTQRHRGCCREAVALVGKVSTDPDGERKEGQQDIKGGLERAPIGEHTGHIEVKGHEHRR